MIDFQLFRFLVAMYVYVYITFFYKKTFLFYCIIIKKFTINTSDVAQYFLILILSFKNSFYRTGYSMSFG